MLLSSVVAIVASLSTSSAAPHEIRHVLHERRDISPEWVKANSLDGRVVLPMRIGLAQNNLHRGPDLLMEVADPTSPKYGKYYSATEIHELFAPSEESVSAVRSWLEAAGIDMAKVSQSHNKQWLQFDAETAEAEALLKTKFHLYEHSSSGEVSVGCDEYHVHENAQPHIDYITPGIKLMPTPQDRNGLEKRMTRTPNGIWKGPIKKPLTISPSQLGALESSGTLNHCDNIITPSCIFAMYNLTTPTTATPGNDLGIFEGLAQYIDQDDMNKYFEYLAPQIPNGTFPTVHVIDGAVNKQNPKLAGTEACLDFQMAYPLIYPQETTLFLTDDDYYQENYHFTGFLNNFLDGIDGSYCTYSAFGETGNSPLDPPYPDPHKGGYKGKLQCGVWEPTNVISISYTESETTSTLPMSYQKRQCNEYMKLGMQGVTVVVSSGDYGVQCTDQAPFIFVPNFPANCPYITTVGATTLPAGAKPRLDQERASTQFKSGGGFSNYLPRPSYQDSAVEAYFNSSAAPTFPYYTNSTIGNGLYNRSGRAYPDVSANGQGFVAFCQNLPFTVGGTSASTPLFASMLTRINAERTAAGKPLIGFANPVLYQNPDAFHDITHGDNRACKDKGFKVGPGWDPVTGLGTPNYPELLKAFMSAA